MSHSDTDGWLGIDRRTLMQGVGATGLAAALFGGSATAQRSDAHGPQRNNRFIVEIGGIVTAGFKHVTIPDAVAAEVEYREGNDPATNRKLKGINEYAPIVLEKGVTADSIELFEWFKLAENGQLDEARRDIAVVLLDTTGEAAARWEFRNAWPGRYGGPELDAMGRDVAIETLELLHEGMERTA